MRHILLASFGCIALALAPRSAEAQTVFGAEQVISSTAAAVQFVATADVDGDGDLDVLSASFDDDTFGWSENTDGAGSFGPRQTISSTADGASAIVAADIDGDSDIDVLTASAFDNTVAWYENTDGAGSFGAEQVISTLANFTQSVFAADIDGDGDLDALSASLGDDKIAWYENSDGAGTFGSQQLITVGADAARFVYAADVDGDGDVDALSASILDDTIAWYENMDGLGTFAAGQNVSTIADGPQSLHVADIDRDGDLDVLSASGNDDTLAWYANTDGAGTFGAMQLITDTADGALSIVAADVDGDGDLDVVSGAQLDNEVAWYENTDGLGSFGTAQVLNAAALGAFTVATADVDGDGDLDVLSASFLDDTIAWYPNQTIHRSGAFTNAERLTQTVGRFVGAFLAVAADIDGDGDLDALVASKALDTVAWYENTDGKGLFGLQQVITNSGPDEILVAADLDSDGDVDVLIASNGGGISWFENTDGFGSFGPEQSLPVGGSEATATFAADIDGDGDLDVVSGFVGTDPLRWHENLDGAGAFGPQQVISAPITPEFITAADIDGDGDLDILTGAFLINSIAWHENLDGQGTFGLQRIVTTTVSFPESLAAADFDQDGDLDIVSADLSGDEIAWFENSDGLGNFGSPQVITAAVDRPRSVFAADMDSDGDLDVLAASSDDDTVGWYENTDGLGSFGPERVINDRADGAAAVFGADFDGDGDLDVLSASEVDGTIAWYENADGRGRFVSTVTFPTAAAPPIARGLSPADIDGDGDLDAFVAQDGAGTVVWYANLDGAGRFGPENLIAPPADTQSIDSADIDQDGDVDLIAGTRSEIVWFENQDGLGSFGAEQLILGTASEVAIFVHLADIDGDGDPDAIASDLDPGTLAWFENTDGLGGFGSQQSISVSVPGVRPIRSADIDRDGDLDVVTGNFDSGVVGWYENTDGQANFGPQQVINSLALGAVSLDIADLDGDGDLDVVSASFTVSEFAWYENTDGLGAFGPRQLISSSADGTTSVAALDVDRDGDLDVVGSSLFDDAYRWYENTDGQGSFGPGRVISKNGEQAAMVFAGDVDRDGDPDVMSSPFFDHQAWHPNQSGQVALTTTSPSDTSPLAGETIELLRFELRHLGRAGDANAELAQVSLLFDRTPPTPVSSDPVGPLTSAEANALFERLRVYRDDGSGQLEPGLDPVVATVETLGVTAGIQVVPFTDGDPNAQVGAAASGLFFVEADLSITAGSAEPSAFRVRHLSSLSETLHMGTALVLAQGPGSGNQPGLIRVSEPGVPLLLVAGVWMLGRLHRHRTARPRTCRPG